MNKVCFISSTGGHFNQLLKIIKEIDLDENEHFIITEKNSAFENKQYSSLYQQDRKKNYFPFVIMLNSLLSVYFMFKYRPKIIISTGAGVVLPFLFLAKILRKKVIYIESYAKINSPTITGQIVYRFKLANEFYVQWPTMLRYYPNAKFKGAIF